MAEPFRDAPLPDEEVGKADADLLKTARERYQKALDADRQNREDGLDDRIFLAGDQWPDEIEQERSEDGRPILTIPLLNKFVHQVTGDIRLNKPSLKTRPADDVADEEVADVYSGLIRNIESESDATDCYVMAAESAAQCGIGHFRIVTEYSSDDTFDQDIRIRPIVDPDAVTWDPQSIRKTREDARYCFVEERIDLATFRARYPDASLTGFDFSDTNGRSAVGDWITHETVRIAEYWTKTPAKRTLARLTDGRTLDVTGLESAEVALDDGRTVKVYVAEDGSPLEVERERVVMRDKVEMRIINGTEVLEGPFEFPVPYIPVIPVIGEQIHVGNRIVRHGVIRFAKDAQRMYNYSRTAYAEHVALQPKAPFMVTPTNIEGVDHIWKEANRRNQPYLPYTPDPKNSGIAPQRVSPPVGSAALMQDMQTSMEEMHGTTGIYPPALGQKSNETSGVAIAQRKQESDVGTFTYSDNLARAIRYAGKILVALIPKIYDTERQIRILNEDDSTEPVKINQRVANEAGEPVVVNDLALGKYDVVVTTGPSFTTKRQEAANGMLEWARNDPDGAALIRDLIAKNLDWPGADEMAERFRKALPPGMAEPREGEAPPQPAPPTPEQKAAMAEQERKTIEAAAKAEKTEAETEGVKLDNAKKQLEIAMATGDMQAFIEQQVMGVVMRMLGGNAGGTPQPQPVAQPAMIQQ